MKKSKIFTLIQSLTEFFGPVGYEFDVQNHAKKIYESFGLECELDTIGNLFAMIKDRNASSPKIAIVSHADEIGFLVKDILGNGFLKLAFNTAATTPDARFLAGKSLKILNSSGEFVEGFFGLRSGHIAGIEGKKRPILFQDMFVDVGCSTNQEVKKLGITIGSPAVFKKTTEAINNTNNIFGKSMDNRVGMAIQIALSEKIKDSNKNITFISCVQEEIGMKGAANAAKRDHFDYVINVDVGLTGDIPGTKNDHIPVGLGKGPIIVIKDFSIHYNFEMINLFTEFAEKANIPYQRAVYDRYSTDGMEFFKHGMKTLTLGIPCRYTHTDFETINLEDVQNCINLILTFIDNVT